MQLHRWVRICKKPGHGSASIHTLRPIFRIPETQTRLTMKKFFIIAGVLIFGAIAGVGVFVATFDVDAYRGKIAQTLSKQTGRTVTLSGPIKLGLSAKG